MHAPGGKFSGFRQRVLGFENRADALAGQVGESEIFWLNKTEISATIQPLEFRWIVNEFLNSLEQSFCSHC